MKADIINLKNGELYFGNQEFISAKTTYDEILNMKGKIDDSIEIEKMGIRSLHFFNKEIEGNFYQISIRFDFEKLSMFFIEFKDGKQLLELPAWKEMKFLKQYSNPTKTQMKTKNYHWGSLFASYNVALNSGNMKLRYR